VETFGSLTSLVGVVSPGIAALKALLEYKGGDVGKAAIKFEADMVIIVEAVARLATRFETVGVTSAQNMQKSMEDMRDAIAAGLGAVTGMADVSVPGNVLFTVQEFAKTVANDIGIMERAVRGGINNLKQEFQGARNPVVSALNDMTAATLAFGRALNGLSLPSWLEPGSPPPLAYALRDVRNEVRSLDAVTSRSALLGSARMPVYTGIAPQLAMAGITNSNQTVNVNMGGQTLSQQVDAVQLANVVERVMRRALRGY